MKLTFRRGMAGAATAALAIGAAVIAAPAHAASDSEYVLYITNWGDTDVVKQLHDSGVANYVTTINYAFGDVAPANLTRDEASGHPDRPETGTGTVDWTEYDRDEHGPIVCKPTDPDVDFFDEVSAEDSLSGKTETGGLVQQVALLKQMHPQIKVVPSIGGATLSKWFSLASLTEESRAELIDSCVDLWIDGNYSDDENGEADNFAGVFDGVDIDWEYPAFVDGNGVPEDRSGNNLSIDANDAANYTALAKEFRVALEAALDGPALVTAATPASPWTGDGYDFPGLADHLDWFSVMAYDLHGTWEGEVGYGAAIVDKEWGVNQTVAMYQSWNGIDPSKIVLGVPFYGPSWTSVEPTDDGDFFFEGEKWGSPATLGVEGTPDRNYDWNEIVAILAADPSLEIQWDEVQQAAYIYDAANQQFYSFDDPQAIQTKIRSIVNELGLRGVMVWEWGGDTEDGDMSHLIIEELGLPFVATVPLPEEPVVDDEEEVEEDDGDDVIIIGVEDDGKNKPAPIVEENPDFTG